MTPEALIIENLFMVVNKDGKDVPFKLNSAQRTLDAHLTQRNIVPKARQEGISTYFLARFTAACMMKRNVKAVIISHDTESTQRLLQRCNYFLDNLRIDKRPVVGRSSLNTITFPKMDSMLYIGTAGSKKFGRGDTITHLHCSEYAYWPNPKDLLSGLLQAVPMTGEISIESTGNGKGNDYHKRTMRAFNKQSVWKCHFFPWHTFEEYQLPLSENEKLTLCSNLIEDWKEPELLEMGLTPEQLAWRRIKLEELDYDIGLFEQEYPMTIDQCFKASGQSLFQSVNYKESEDWCSLGNHLYVKRGHPRPGYTYSLGADPSGGTGGDNAGICVFCVDTGEQVAEYAHNFIEPDTFGVKCVDIGRMFNEAFLTVESNNHGPVTIKMIRDEGYPENKIYMMESTGGEFSEDPTLMQFGFRTTKRTKPILIGNLRTMLIKDLTIHSPSLNDELSTFIEHENGELGAQENCHDDRVIASALAAIGMSRAALYASPKKAYVRERDKTKSPFTLDAIIEELRSRGKRLPISPQHNTTLH